MVERWWKKGGMMVERGGNAVRGLRKKGGRLVEGGGTMVEVRRKGGGMMREERWKDGGRIVEG